MTPTRQFPGFLTSLTFLIFLFTTLAVSAEFTNSFTNLYYGSAVRLAWDTTTIPPESYPLFITAQLIDKGENGDGGSVAAYRINLTTTAIDSASSSNSNAFEWTGIPSPLRWLPEGQGFYQVELHGSGSGSADGTTTTPLAKSPFFAVGAPPYAGGTEGEGGEPSSSDSSGDEVRFFLFFLRLAPCLYKRRGNSAD